MFGFRSKIKAMKVEGFAGACGQIFETEKEALESLMVRGIEDIYGTHKIYSWDIVNNPKPLYNLLKKYYGDV